METIHLHHYGGNEAAREHAFTWAMRLEEWGDTISCEVDDTRANFANLLMVNLTTGTASGSISERFSDCIRELVKTIPIPNRVHVQLQLTHGVKQDKFELPSQQAEAIASLKARINPYHIEETRGFHTILRGRNVVYQIPVPDVGAFRDRTTRSNAIREHLEGLVSVAEIPMVLDAIVTALD